MTTVVDQEGFPERIRGRLFRLAYRMLGDVHEAEDIVQDAMLRWHTAEPGAVDSPDGWLVTVTSRLAIDRLRHLRTERALYDGPWLPTPMATAHPAAADREVERASDLSMAFLMLLERLGPEERVAFLLREVFDTAYSDIARLLETPVPSVRQLVHRARARVRVERARFTAPPAARAQLLQRFLTALQADDADALLAVFAEDATFTSDGGGKVSAMREVVRGARHVAQALLGFERMGRGLATHRITPLNGEAAIMTLVDGRVVFVTCVACDGDRVSAVYRVLNPDKLGHLGVEIFEWPERHITRPPVR